MKNLTQMYRKLQNADQEIDDNVYIPKSAITTYISLFMFSVLVMSVPQNDMLEGLTETGLDGRASIYWSFFGGHRIGKSQRKPFALPKT